LHGLQTGGGKKKRGKKSGLLRHKENAIELLGTTDFAQKKGGGEGGEKTAF